jgi:hypothetical protein
MATAEDALELITSRQYVTALGRSNDEPVAMQAGAIIRELLARGAEDEMAARVLITQAAESLGGRTRIVHRESGLAAGGPDLPGHFELWMPRHRLRD